MVAVENQLLLLLLLPIMCVCLQPYLSSMQNACAIFSSVACLHLPYICYLISRMIFGGKNRTEHKTYVLIFTTNFSEIFLILSRIQRVIIINVQRA